MWCGVLRCGVLWFHSALLCYDESCLFLVLELRCVGVLSLCIALLGVVLCCVLVCVLLYVVGVVVVCVVVRCCRLSYCVKLFWGRGVCCCAVLRSVVLRGVASQCVLLWCICVVVVLWWLLS